MSFEEHRKIAVERYQEDLVSWAIGGHRDDPSNEEIADCNKRMRLARKGRCFKHPYAPVLWKQPQLPGGEDAPWRYTCSACGGWLSRYDPVASEDAIRIPG